MLLMWLHRSGSKWVQTCGGGTHWKAFTSNMETYREDNMKMDVRRGMNWHRIVTRNVFWYLEQ